jgi:hypothetical protein
MRTLVASLTFLLSLAPAWAQVGPSVDEVPALNTWIAARAAAARKGAPELVRIPIAFRSLGWGCKCPDAYLGTDTNSHSGGGWLKVSAAKGLTLPSVGRQGLVIVAEGTFTGKQVKEDLRDGKDGPKEWIYQLWEFEALRTRSYRDADAKVQIVLGGKELKQKVPPLGDDRPWIVVVESFPAADKRSAARAEALRQTLVKDGFAAAEVFDSRRAERLFCCYLVVAAGRFKTKAEAMASARSVRAKKHKDVTVRQGW